MPSGACLSNLCHLVAVSPRSWPTKVSHFSGGIGSVLIWTWPCILSSHYRFFRNKTTSWLFTLSGLLVNNTHPFITGSLRRIPSNDWFTVPGRQILFNHNSVGSLQLLLFWELFIFDIADLLLGARVNLINNCLHPILYHFCTRHNLADKFLLGTITADNRFLMLNPEPKFFIQKHPIPKLPPLLRPLNPPNKIPDTPHILPLKHRPNTYQRPKPITPIQHLQPVLLPAPLPPKPIIRPEPQQPLPLILFQIQQYIPRHTHILTLPSLCPKQPPNTHKHPLPFKPFTNPTKLSSPTLSPKHRPQAYQDPLKFLWTKKESIVPFPKPG